MRWLGDRRRNLILICYEERVRPDDRASWKSLNHNLVVTIKFCGELDLASLHNAHTLLGFTWQEIGNPRLKPVKFHW